MHGGVSQLLIILKEKFKIIQEFGQIIRNDDFSFLIYDELWIGIFLFLTSNVDIGPFWIHLAVLSQPQYRLNQYFLISEL
jgi:hypothetical protein